MYVCCLRRFFHRLWASSFSSYVRVVQNGSPFIILLALVWFDEIIHKKPNIYSDGRARIFFFLSSFLQFLSFLLILFNYVIIIGGIIQLQTHRISAFACAHIPHDKCMLIDRVQQTGWLARVMSHPSSIQSLMGTMTHKWKRMFLRT